MHCTRLAVAFIDSASARASIDLPVPGRSSKRMWPSQSMATRASRTTSVLPLMTVSTFSTTMSKFALKSSAPSSALLDRVRVAGVDDVVRAALRESRVETMEGEPSSSGGATRAQKRNLRGIETSDSPEPTLLGVVRRPPVDSCLGP